MSRNRWIAVTVITAVVIAIVIYGFIPGPVPVDIAEVSRGTMSVTIEEEGKTGVKELFVVSAPVTGYLRRIKLDVGDSVKKGQILAELEPLRSSILDPRSRASAEAAVFRAEAEVEAAEEKASEASAASEYAKANLDRIRKLYKAGYVSKEAFDRAEADAKRTEANLLSALASVKAALAELDKVRTALRFSAEGADKAVALRAPVNGRVLKIHHESEGVVNSGEPLIDLGNTERLEVRVEVLSEDAVKIKPGTSVLFKRWGGDETLYGRVIVIEPAGFTKVSSLGVEEQRVLVISEITSTAEARQKLGDGYRVEAEFVVWEEKDVLQIPVSALFRRGDGWAVFVAKRDRAELRKVSIGRRNGLSAQIISGLSEGESVITYPDGLIKDSTRIRKR